MRTRSLLVAGLLGLSLNVSAQDAGVPSAVVDVPFVAQAEDLCGGAAAAMVLRYWGAQDIQAEDFAALVDHRAGGISARDLSAAIAARGLEVRGIRAQGQDIVRELSDGRPVIALIDAGGGRRHFVVIVAWASGHVLFHDPALGPFRVATQSDFLARWKVTDELALVMAPDATGRISARPVVKETASTAKPSACDALIDPAIEVARGTEPENAVPALLAASQLCSTEARPVVALAGVRFRQKRWNDAAVLSRQALLRDPADQENLRLLAASLYLEEKPTEALEVWNRVGEPRIDSVKIAGLGRTRQDIATRALGLHPRDVLTHDSLRHAQHRLFEMPTSGGSKVVYETTTGGRADVIASFIEMPLLPPWWLLLGQLAGTAAIKKEVELFVNSPTRRGEGLDIDWRFETRRPSVSVALAVPRLAGLPGIVTLVGLWDKQTYRSGDLVNAPVSVETRRRGSADWADWVTPNVRLELGGGIDRFDDAGNFVSLRGGFESRLARDHIALRGDASRWIGAGSARDFSEFGGTLAYRSSVPLRTFVVTARFDGRRATADAPLAIWEAASKGGERTLLLRGTPLIDDGYLSGPIFGRGLLHGTVEAEVKAASRGALSAGIAAFSDWARAWDAPSANGGTTPNVFGVGLGVRLHGFGKLLIRGDLAFQPGHKGLVVSGGLSQPWPR